MTAKNVSPAVLAGVGCGGIVAIGIMSMMVSASMMAPPAQRPPPPEPPPPEPPPPEPPPPPETETASPSKRYQVPKTAITKVDCVEEKEHEICRAKGMARHAKKIAHWLVELPPGEWQSSWVWRHECTQNTTVTHRRILKDKAVTITECRAVALWPEPVKQITGVLGETSPETLQGFFDRGIIVHDIFKDAGATAGWVLDGYFIVLYPPGVREPKTFEVETTEFDRNVVRF